MTRKASDGFTLMELASTISAGSILAVTMTVMVVMSYNELHALDGKVRMERDAAMLNRWLYSRLTLSQSSTIAVYADSTAEAAGLDGDVGSILTIMNADSTAIRIAPDNYQFEWSTAGVGIRPLDHPIANLTFRKDTVNNKQLLWISLGIVGTQDTSDFSTRLVLHN